MWVLNTSSSGEPEEMCQSNYYYAKNHTVGDEGVQSPSPQVVDEEVNHKGTRDRAYQDPHHHGRAHLKWNAAFMLHEVVELFRGGGRDRGRRQQEREPRLCCSIHISA